MTDRLAVAYVTDGNRDDLTYASAVALGLNHVEPIDIHVVQSGFSEQIPGPVERFLQSRGHRIVTRPISAPRRGAVGRGHISAAGCEKVTAIDLLAEDYRRLCYMDNDTLLLRPTDLAVTVPTSTALSAVPDAWVSTGQDNPRFFANCAKHGLPTRYFNAGYLAVRSEAWVESGISARFDEELARHAHFCYYLDGPCADVDQCALNVAAAQHWTSLPFGYNAQRSLFQTAWWKDASVRHYTGVGKFLPVHVHRADRRELNVLAAVKQVCPELRLRVPVFAAGIPYEINKIRRRQARRTIAAAVHGRMDELFV